MAAVLRGLGWVTPLGAGLEATWARLMAGDRAEIKPLVNPETGRSHPHMPVPPALVEALGRNPRLRRSSPLSYFAATACLAALAHAGFTPELGRTARVAVIFAVSSGSVIYTRRFYEQVTKQGANAASPLLFPETVYNAPASHLAALMGIEGASYTLVGDNSVGLAALQMGEQLLALGEADFCLVAATEELDWVLGEGYRDWRFAARDGDSRLFAVPAPGAILAEGAAAVLLAPDGEGPVLRHIHPGVSFSTRREAGAALDRVLADLLRDHRADCLIGSANGSFTDRGEALALHRHAPALPLVCPKSAWGESLGAGALLQTIVAALALRRGELPPTLFAAADAPAALVRESRRDLSLRSAFILAAGLNQQAGGAVLTRPE